MIRELGRSISEIGATVAALQQSLPQIRPMQHQQPLKSVLFQDDQEDVLDDQGNLRGDRIGLSIVRGRIFLRGTPVVMREDSDGHESRYSSGPRREASSSPGPYSSSGPYPASSSGSSGPYSASRRHSSPTRTASHGPARIQRFNGRSLDWTAWFRHFRAVAELQEWDDRMKAVQLVSYLDDLPMNIVQELSDDELYDYDVLVRTLDKRFDPASRVSTYRSKFHGCTRRHQEEAEQFADELNMLCRCGYPHSSPQMRRELICEQLVRGQAETELQRHLWVVMRTQPERDLQTLIEVCNDFSSMRPTQSLHVAFRLRSHHHPEMPL